MLPPRWTAVAAVALAGLMLVGCLSAFVARRPGPADNAYCFVCHANYTDEPLARGHQAHGIGCERCHGPSDRHSADEDALTPPDVMFAKSAITPFCSTCHAPDHLAKYPEHKPVLAPATASKLACTDCHGKHRLTVRTRRWDKHTRKLVADDGVRMMYKNSPATRAR